MNRYEEWLKRAYSGLQGKKLIFLQMGFMVMFLWVLGLELVESQEIPDTTTQEETDIFIIHDIMPEFPGGDDALIQFLMDNIKYPKENLQGRAVVGFVIEIDGSITDVEVLRSSRHPVLDKEAIRVIKLMPNWTYGTSKGKPARVRMRIPVTFALEDEESEKNTLEEMQVDTICSRDVVDELPEFPGGMKLYNNFLFENLRYPLSAKKAGMEGQVMVVFVIEKDGSVTNFDIQESSGHSVLDEEALRVARLMPKWKPAKYQGMAVRIKDQMSISFKLY